MAAAVILLAAISHAGATDGTWINSTSNSTWGTAGNWSGGAPGIASGVDAIANFSTLDLLAARTVNLGANWTVGGLLFGDADTSTAFNWTLANGTGGPWILTLATSTGAPVINVVSQTVAISAALGGTQGFTKTGTGTLTLTGANSISGGITLSQGVLNFAANTLNNNTVTFTGAATLTWNGSNVQDVSGLVRINDGVTATFNSGANTITLGTAFQLGVSGNAAVVKSGAGTLIITAANTWTGGTTVGNGTMILSGGDNRLSTSGSLGMGTGANSGILQLGDAGGAVSQTVTSLTVTGNGSSTSNAVVGGNAAVSTLIINNAAADTYAGLLGGVGANQNNLALTKTGAGALTLSNTGNTFSGGVNISQGTLSFASGALAANQVTFLAASTLQWGAGNTQDVSAHLKISDGIIASLDTVANTVTLSTALQTGPLGTGGLTKVGVGTLVITAANTYTGNTRINNGRLILTGGDNRVSSATLQFGNAATSGILQLGDATGPSNQTVNSITVTGNASSLSNAIVGGNAAISTLTLNNSANVTWAQFLGGGGTNENNLALTKSGTGSLTLSGANTFVGNVTINSGTVAIKSSSALGAGTKTVSINGATGGPSLKLDGSTGDISLAAGIGFVTSNDNATTPAILSSAGNNIIGGNIALASGGFGTGNTRITVNAGTLVLNGNIAPAASAASSRNLILDGSASGTINGVVSDNGALGLGVSKQGTGTWTLTAANAYTGGTQVNGGRLNITTAQTGGGALSIADAATLGLTLAGAGQSLQASSFVFGATTGATLSFNLGSFTNPAVALISAGSFSTNGTNTVNISGTALSVGVFNLISYTGSIGGSGFAGLTLGSLPARVTANLVDNSAGSSVQLNISAFDVPKWTGAVSNVWDINDGPDPTTGTGTVNWKEATSGTATRYLQTGSTVDSVLFDDSATGSTNINLSTTLAPTSVTVNNSLLAYTFGGTGKLSGATSLTKQGSGTLILANSGGNDYTGTTTISGGTLQVGDGITLGAGQLGSGNVIDNGTLVLDRPAGDDITFSNVISGTGTLNQQGGNTVVLSGNNGSFDGAIIVSSGALRVGSANALGTTVGGVTVQNGAALELTGQNVADNILLNGGTLRTFSGTNNSLTGVLTLNTGTIDQFNSTILTIGTVITGSGGLTKSGNGTLILTAANSYSGGTVITGGNVQLGATGGAGTTGAFGAGDINFATASGNSATLTILRADNVLNISNNITSTGAGTNTIIIGVTGATSPSGTVTFSGSNSFTGNVTITGGALKITNSNALGVGPKTVSIANNSGPALELDGSGGNITLASGINFSLSSDGTIVNATSNPGSIVNLAGDNVINGSIALVNGGGGNGRLHVQGGTLTVNGSVDSTGATGARTLQIGGPGNGTITGTIADAAFAVSVTKDGIGTWILTGGNTFSGAVAVQNGTLQINGIAALGLAQPLGAASSAITLGTATTTGVLEYTGSSDATLARPVTVNGVGGGVIKNSGAAVLTLAGTVTKNGRPLTLTGGVINVTAVVAGATLSDLIINNSVVTLSNPANTFNATTYVYGGGILKNGVTNALPTTTTLTLGETSTNTGGTYDLNGFNVTVAGLNSAGTGPNSVTNNAASGLNTLTVSGTSTFGGIIGDGTTAKTALTKSGSGIFTLTNVNSFTGGTTINSGTLDLTSSALITSNTIINSGGKLINSGTVSGSVTVQTGGSLFTTEASATGLATINGSITLGSGADWFFDLGGTTRGAALNGYDAVDGITQLTLSGTLHLNLVNGYAPSQGDSFDLLDWTHLSDPGNVNGSGLVFDLGGAPLAPGLNWDTSNFLTTGVVSVVAFDAPEPGRLVLLGGTAVALFMRRRR